MKNHRSAFTRLELLAVVFIAILSILILVPVLSAAKKQLSAVEICAWKQRTILRALNDYANDNNDWYPVVSDGVWDGTDSKWVSVEELLLEGGYLDSATCFQCPSDDADFGPLSAPVKNNYTGEMIYERTPDNYRTYGLNLNYDGWASGAKGVGRWSKRAEV